MNRQHFFNIIDLHLTTKEMQRLVKHIYFETNLNDIHVYMYNFISLVPSYIHVLCKFH